MITYVYVVKCPNCEDEYFDFFKEAEAYALGKLSEKPIITQTEVNRNDFGECIDHCDLGTVWSWEDMMKDTCTDDEPAKCIFTRDDLKDYIPDEDAEFGSIDNSVNFEIEEVSDDPRKPIPEGMTIEELVEAMEDNEDTVECTKCGNLVEKSSCHHNKEGFGWCCSDCEPEDTLVEEANEYDLATLVKDSINHLVSDLSKDPWADDFADDVIRDLENNYVGAPEDMIAYNNWCSAVASEVSRQVNRDYALTEAQAVADSTALGKQVQLVINGAEWNLTNVKQSLKAQILDPGISRNSINFIVKFDNICKVMQETEAGYLVRVPCYFRDQQDRSKIIETPIYARLWVSKKYCKFLDAFDLEESRDLGNEYDGGYPEVTPELPETDEISEVSNSNLVLCPECGKDTFDIRSGTCLECGF